MSQRASTDKSANIQTLLSKHEHAKAEIGLTKTGESANFEHCSGVLHVEVMQTWLPLSPEAIKAYAYYNDHQSGRLVYFLFEGGSLYEVLRFEVKAAPEYAGWLGLLGRTPDDRYPEVYLRAVRLPARNAA